MKVRFRRSYEYDPELDHVIALPTAPAMRPGVPRWRWIGAMMVIAVLAVAGGVRTLSSLWQPDAVVMRAGAAVQVEALADGTVTAVHVREGARVRRGEPLVSIQPAEPE